MAAGLDADRAHHRQSANRSRPSPPAATMSMSSMRRSAEARTTSRRASSRCSWAAPMTPWHELRPILGCYGDPVLHVGPIGAGQTVKLVNNALFAAQIGLLAEAVRLGERLGVPESTVLGALAHGSATSRVLDMVGRARFRRRVHRGGRRVRRQGRGSRPQHRRGPRQRPRRPGRRHRSLGAGGKV